MFVSHMFLSQMAAQQHSVKAVASQREHCRITSWPGGILGGVYMCGFSPGTSVFFVIRSFSFYLSPTGSNLGVISRMCLLNLIISFSQDELFQTRITYEG